MNNKKIKLADYPQLTLLTWSEPGKKTVTGKEALKLYCANWRHVDVNDLTAQERDLIERLKSEIGCEICGQPAEFRETNLFQTQRVLCNEHYNVVPTSEIPEGKETEFEKFMLARNRPVSQDGQIAIWRRDFEEFLRFLKTGKRG